MKWPGFRHSGGHYKPATVCYNVERFISSGQAVGRNCMESWDRVAIVGVGLIGGSIGQALLRRQLAREVIGIGHRTESLQAAEQVGAVSSWTTDLATGVAEAQLGGRLHAGRADRAERAAGRRGHAGRAR